MNSYQYTIYDRQTKRVLLAWINEKLLTGGLHFVMAGFKLEYNYGGACYITCLPLPEK